MNLPLKLSGVVKRHLGRGKKLGFPTANLEVATDLPDGIYVGYAKVNGEKLPSLIFIGAAKTFQEAERRIEVYILDFQANIYDKLIEVEVQQKLRENVKFESKEELMGQMKDDESKAREYFAKFRL